MKRKMNYHKKTYSNGHGKKHKAILVPWEELDNQFLHPGWDDDRIISSLIKSEAPDWIKEAEG